MTFWVLVLLIHGQHVRGLAYADPALCHKAAHHRTHQCVPVVFREDR